MDRQGGTANERARECARVCGRRGGGGGAGGGVLTGDRCRHRIRTKLKTGSVTSKVVSDGLIPMQSLSNTSFHTWRSSSASIMYPSSKADLDSKDAFDFEPFII